MPGLSFFLSLFLSLAYVTRARPDHRFARRNLSHRPGVPIFLPSRPTSLPRPYRPARVRSPFSTPPRLARTLRLRFVSNFCHLYSSSETAACTPPPSPVYLAFVRSIVSRARALSSSLTPLYSAPLFSVLSDSSRLIRSRCYVLSYPGERRLGPIEVGAGQPFTKNPESSGAPIARIVGHDCIHTIRQRRITIGHSSSDDEMIDINLNSNIISQRHLDIFYVQPFFFMICNSKNGVFVDEMFLCKGEPAYRLPKKCTISFPGTTIKLMFQSLVDEEEQSNVRVPSLPKQRTPLPLLRINTPDGGYSSPFPSPTGTIRAANSCPTSPLAGQGKRNISEVLQMVAAYAAAVENDSQNFALDRHNLERHDGGQSSSRQISPEPGADARYRGGNSLGPNGTAPHYSPPKDDSKPPFSYVQLIVQAIASAHDKQLTVSGIYSYITKQYPYYRTADEGWQSTIRYTLSTNRAFIKVGNQKGSYWKIDPQSKRKLIEQAFIRKRQRGVSESSEFGLSSRSALASPSHVEISGLITRVNRQASPVAEPHPEIISLILPPELATQSAPNSPVHLEAEEYLVPGNAIEDYSLSLASPTPNYSGNFISPDAGIGGVSKHAHEESDSSPGLPASQSRTLSLQNTVIAIQMKKIEK